MELELRYGTYRIILNYKDADGMESMRPKQSLEKPRVIDQPTCKLPFYCALGEASAAMDGASLDIQLEILASDAN